MKKKMYAAVLLVACMLFALSASVYGDDPEGYNHYGVYNLKNLNIEVAAGSETVTVSQDQVRTVYEYTILNKDSTAVEAVFGVPDSGIHRFVPTVDGSQVKYRTRDEAYLQRNYGVQGIEPEKKLWFLFNVNIGAGEARTFKIDLSAAVPQDKDNSYTLKLLEGRGYAGVIKGTRLPFKLAAEAFRPYDLIALEGLPYEHFSDTGEVNLTMEGQSGITVRYQPVEKLLYGKLLASVYKKPKAIARAVVGKKFTEASVLCDEYLAAPLDAKLEPEQVRMAQAEALRLGGDYIGYLEKLEDLDLTKVYPDRMRYKTAFDKIQYYDTIANAAALEEAVKALYSEVKGAYLGFWLESNGYIREESKPAVPAPSAAEPKDSDRKPNPFAAMARTFSGFKYQGTVLLVLGFALGFIVGRMSRKKRRSRSMYLFRD